MRIWQKNIAKTIIAHVPITNGQVQETGSFCLDGVTFPAAEVPIEFIAPVDSTEAMFPTGHLIEELEVPDIGTFNVTLINAGIATIFLNAEDLGYHGTELQDDINNDQQALQRLEKIRAYGAVKMGLIKDVCEAVARQHTPKLALVGKPQAYVAASGKTIDSSDINLNVRALSMGKLHHAMMGTAAVAIGTAAAIPGTIVSLATEHKQVNDITFGHPSGTLKVGAQVAEENGHWTVEKVMMSRSARILMEGWIRVPER